MIRYKLAFATDLHFDLAGESAINGFIASVREAEVNALAITGDISSPGKIRKDLGRLAGLGIPVYFVLGCGDFFGSRIHCTLFETERACAQHQALVNMGWGEIIGINSDTVLIGHRGLPAGSVGSGTLGRYRGYVPRADSLPSHANLRGDKEAVSLGAQYLEALLPQALKQAEHVVVMTHMPPIIIRGASSKIAAEENECQNPAMGEVLLRWANLHQQKSITVLCGSTHVSSIVRLAKNLTVRVAGAKIGEPKLEDVLHF